MRRLFGGLLFFLGLAGLLLVLVSWLPTNVNLGIVVFVCLLCLGCVWGGGKLLQPLAVSGKTVPGNLVAQPSEQGRFLVVCPKCGWQISSGQRFCGGCGMATGSLCSKCGAVVVPGFRFCTNCGNRLVESGRA